MKELKELNRSKPFAEVCGGFTDHKYEQDGIKFGPDGMEIPARSHKAHQPMSPEAPVEEKQAEDPALSLEIEDEKSFGAKK